VLAFKGEVVQGFLEGNRGQPVGSQKFSMRRSRAVSPAQGTVFLTGRRTAKQDL